MSKKISISPQVSIYVNDAMLDMLDNISNVGKLSLNSVNDQQKMLLKQMHERNLLIRKRRNNDISYSIRPGINWY